MPDVASNLSGEVSHRGEHPACEQIAFDLGKPELNLVQPGRVRRGEVEMDVRVLYQERANGLRLVRREVIGNDVNLAPARLTGNDVAEELHKGGAGMARHGLRKHFTGFRIERRQQRQRPAPVVFEAMAPRGTGRT